MLEMSIAEIQARLIEWQRIATDSGAAAHLRKTARRAVKLHRDELTRRSA